MVILLSNDDGVHAIGLKAMYNELKKIGSVWVVAPLEEKSTTGHSLTIHKPLRMIPMSDRFYGVSGSPADCVYLGIRHVLGKMPDFVVSGINRGANLGQDIYYSGTVSAAREACMLGIPSLAVSLAVNFAQRIPESKLNYSAAAKLTAQLVCDYKKLKIPKHTLLNFNVPNLTLSKIKGIKLASQGFRHYSGSILKRTDHRGKDYYWVGGRYKGFVREPHTDCMVVESSFASLTPLKLDTTDNDYLKKMKATWGRS
jgi:5'-nucleotidase